MSENSITTLDIRSHPPTLFRLAKWLQRTGFRGGYRIERLGRQLFWDDGRAVKSQVSPSVELAVPIAIRSYAAHDVRSYEKESLDFLASLVSELGKRDVTLIDCGADFGLFSANLVARCPSVSHVIAFEPNQDAFPYLAHNLDSLPVSTQGVNSAVADFVGRARLEQPSFDSSPHAAFITRDAEGTVEVVTVDSLVLPSTLDAVLVKIDVEGGELAVLKGAVETLSAAKQFIVSFEAHPSQTDRVGIDPMELVHFVRGIRDCRVFVSERPDVRLRTDEGFWDQMPDREIYNICLTTT